MQALPSLESGDTAAICAPELQNSLEECEASMQAVAQVARGCVELQVRATERDGDGQGKKTERAGWCGVVRWGLIRLSLVFLVPFYESCH